VSPLNKRVTIKDVAKEAGVAKSTVSRTFNAGESVSPVTKEKVLRIATQLGYSPNPLAQALSVSSTKTVAIVIPNMESIHISQVTRGVINTLSKHGYSVITVDTSENFGMQTSVHKPLANQLVDGIINCYASANDEIKQLSLMKPVVCIGDKPDGYEADYVGIDYEQGYHRLCHYLKEKNKNNICLINGQRDRYAVGRSEDFQRIARSLGLSMVDEWVLYANWTPYSGYQAMQELLCREEKKPDVVVCASDMVALGALKAINNAGYRVPEDIAICGMDDSMISKYTIPSLTTLKFSPYRLGKKAAEVMLERLKNKDLVRTEHVMSVDVEKRNSVSRDEDHLEQWKGENDE